MDARTLRVLEYDAVRQRLRSQAASSLGKELAERVEPAGDLEQVRRLLAETTQARALLAGGGRPPLGGVHDVRAQVVNASRGGVLSERDLLEVSDTVYASRRMRGYLQQTEIECPLITSRAADLGTFQEIEQAVAASIDNRGEVADTASEQLRAIRTKIRRLQESVEQRLHSILHSSQHARMIQEPIVTVRNGRYCIPVRSEFKGAFRGIVHDSSSSGATVFMEPFAVVEVNNEVREERSAEEREVRRILARLSGMVGEVGQEILATIQTLTGLDLIFARAALADQMDAIDPEINSDGKVDLIQSRHPLLEGRVVPIDIKIGEEFSALVLTGPNTGGKTVSLKTLGLLTLMAQTGLHIPAAHGSRAAVFSKIFADIGDEQSIQQSLSTFSSHMTQVVKVLDSADDSSLVLLDEIGAGTDPAEGSALAKSVLIELLRRGSRVIATTHYGELKAFAYTQPGVENASVEFNSATLEPTFEVRIGTPGSSNAFAIASRLGMSADVLRQAAEMMGESQVELHEVIQRAERGQRDLAEERRAAARAGRELDQTRAEYEKLLAELKGRRRDMLAGSREEARRIVSRAKERTEDLLNLLRQSVQEAREAKDAIEREAELVRKFAPPEPADIASVAREELSEISAEAAEATAEAAEPEALRAPEPEPGPVGELVRGEAVLVRSVRQKGSVLEPPDESGQVQVQIGLLRLSVPVTDLSPVREAMLTVTRAAPDHVRVAMGPVSTELHLRGLRVDAAVYELDRYLDRAAVVRHERVRIVHGKGTGAVRAGVHERLKEHPLVKSFRLAEVGEGDAGVTVVELGERE
ncbi:MAG: endonuclease MutS2 [Armatimonadetes bacterium]|nr:endonuclease MutS2 [Armatimonadota bacterium]